MSKFVRLKPHNGKTHKLKTYTVFGIKFMESRGWYEVEDDVADYCRTVKQIQEGPDAEYAAPAFDVVNSLEEAKQIDENEKKRQERALAEHANKATRVHTTSARGRHAPAGALTSDDVTHKKPPSFDDQDDTFPEGDDDIAPRTPSPQVVVDGADDTELAPSPPTVPALPSSGKAPKPKK